MAFLNAASLENRGREGRKQITERSKHIFQDLRDIFIYIVNKGEKKDQH